MTPTGGAGTKVGLSDPVVESGIAIAQRIKATPVSYTHLSASEKHRGTKKSKKELKKA